MSDDGDRGELDRVSHGPPPVTPDRAARALEAALGSLRPSSRRTYAGHWRRLAAHHGYEPADFVAVFLHLDPMDAAALVGDYLEHLERNGKSARYRHTCVGAVFGMLRRWRAAGVTDLDLRDLIHAPKLRQGRGRADVPKPAEAEALIGTVRAAAEAGSPHARRDLALVLLLHDSGLRRGEAIGLRVGDYSAAEQCVWVRSKGADMREPQPVSDRGRAALEAWIDGRIGDPTAPIFPARAWGLEPMEGADVYYTIGVWCERAGLRKIAPHLLRHACGTELAKRGATLAEVQRFLRHATPAQSMRYFAEDRARGVELARSFDVDPDQACGAT